MNVANRKKTDPSEIIKTYLQSREIMRFLLSPEYNVIPLLVPSASPSQNNLNGRIIEYFQALYLNEMQAERETPEITDLVTTMSCLTPGMEKKEWESMFDRIEGSIIILEERALTVIDKLDSLILNDEFQVQTYDQRDEVYADFPELAQRMDNEPGFGPRTSNIKIITVDGQPVLTRVNYTEGNKRIEVLKQLVYTD
jgi:hypothetical protein